MKIVSNISDPEVEACRKLLELTDPRYQEMSSTEWFTQRPAASRADTVTGRAGVAMAVRLTSATKLRDPRCRCGNIAE